MTDTELDPRELKVLLIDDEQFIRTTVRQILLQAGVVGSNVYEADSAKAAVAETVRVRPHLVLCDIHMPGEDGFAFVASLRKAPFADVAATPVVMLTSDAGVEAVLTAKDLHVSGYLVKPISVSDMKKAIERALKITLP